jgi:hypothetical protein
MFFSQVNTVKGYVFFLTCYDVHFFRKQSCRTKTDKKTIRCSEVEHY